MAKVNNWREIRKADPLRAKRQALVIWLLEMAGCLAIGFWLGWIYGGGW